MNTCTICGKEMKFIEGDIIHEENWYHGTCVRTRSQNVAVIHTKDITMETKYVVLD